MNGRTMISAVAVLAAAVVGLAALACTPAIGFASASYVPQRDIDYDLGSPPLPPSTPDMNQLDLYLPPHARAGSRPVVVWIHGGGWRKGGKRIGVRKKAELFTGAGYVFASVNYRLSAAPFDPALPDPNRVMFPAQPDDVGEAIGWLDAHVDEYGGDRRRIVLIGHSAGAHLASLVATDPSYVRRYGVRATQIIGFASLDPPAFDIAAGADPDSSRRPEEGREMLWNAFGTPAENAATGSWAAASPVEFAGPNDPPALLVTQADNRQRLVDHRAMALALGRDPGKVILSLALDHREISRVLGDPYDASGETASVMAFVRGAVAAERPARVRITRRPPRRVPAGGEPVEVSFAFRSGAPGARFRCRLDEHRFAPCRSPRSYRVEAGRHHFAVRALAQDAEPGPATSFRFRVLGSGARR